MGFSEELSRKLLTLLNPEVNCMLISIEVGYIARVQLQNYSSDRVKRFTHYLIKQFKHMKIKILHGVQLYKVRHVF